MKLKTLYPFLFSLRHLVGGVFLALSIPWTVGAQGPSCTQVFISPMTYPEGAIPISGYASKFGNRDKLGDMTLPGSFQNREGSDALKVKMFFNHWGRPIGVWTKIVEDSLGLYVEGYVNPALPEGQRMLKEFQHKPFFGLSIGGIYTKTRHEGDSRLLEEVDLLEVSVVQDPVNTAAYFTPRGPGFPEQRKMWWAW